MFKKQTNITITLAILLGTIYTLLQKARFSKYNKYAYNTIYFCNIHF